MRNRKPVPFGRCQTRSRLLGRSVQEVPSRDGQSLRHLCLMDYAAKKSMADWRWKRRVALRV